MARFIVVSLIALQDHQIYGYLPMIDDGVIKIGSTPFVLVQSDTFQR